MSDRVDGLSQNIPIPRSTDGYNKDGLNTTKVLKFAFAKKNVCCLFLLIEKTEAAPIAPSGAT